MASKSSEEFMAEQHKKVSFLFSVLFSFSLVLTPIGAGAAILYLEPASGEYHSGDTFIVEARIDTEGECINTVKVDLSFSKDILEVIDFSQGNSILTLWLQTPKIDQKSGSVSFTGGIPGGYCGPLPGEPGKPDLLLKLIFRLTSGGLSSVNFGKGSVVLLNDGFGTPAKLTLKEAIFTILPEKREIPKEEWQEEIGKDNIPPEPFEIKIHKDPSIFEGKYFLVFQTVDKQTGIDRYEVKEGKRNWKIAESPYLLEDQSLKSIIKVKAVDKAGNERIAEYIPAKKLFPYWIIILVLIGAGIIWWIITKQTRNKTRNRHETYAKKY